MERIKTYFLETRPHFLLLTISCFLVGPAVAYHASGNLNWLHFAIAFAGALSAHIAVNVLNDYFDFKSGLDLRTNPTSFSGGSGIILSGKMSPREVLIFGLAAVAFTASVGVFFLLARGWELLLIGIPGLLIVGFYTQYITRSPFLCLMAPGVGFGLCMALGGYFALQGEYSWRAAAASVVPTLLVSNLLLLNQFPDAEADTTVGRRHILIAYGKKISARVYAFFLIATFLWIGVAASLNIFPRWTLLALLPFPLALRNVYGAVKFAENRTALIPYLGTNVIIILTTPLLLAAGFFLG